MYLPSLGEWYAVNPCGSKGHDPSQGERYEVNACGSRGEKKVSLKLRLWNSRKNVTSTVRVRKKRSLALVARIELGLRLN